jgi:hypothetical protein
MTGDFWSITLPNSLATSAYKSPALLAYFAALNIHDADVLLSKTKVRSRLDPAISLKKGIERHHLFPKGYLKINGMKDRKKVDQIANFAFVEWFDNIEISDEPPSKYWPEQVTKRMAKAKFNEKRLNEQMDLHALPKNWESMEYDVFLQMRRVLMADVARRAFELLKSDSYVQPTNRIDDSVLPTFDIFEASEVSISGLMEAGLLHSGDDISASVDYVMFEAIILSDGKLKLEDDHDGEVIYENVYDLQRACDLSGSPWSTWYVDRRSGRILLSDLVDELDERDYS